MKNRILFLLAAMFASIASFAQSHNVVTLTHEGNVQAFYGLSAFADAIAAADNGDYVTLSSGTFNGTTIDKAVNIRGAGMWDDATDPENIISQTIIKGELIFKIPDEVTKSFSMEGVYVNCKIQTGNWIRNATFKKCYLDFFNAHPFKNVTFLNCYVRSFARPWAADAYFVAINSYIGEIGNSNFKFADTDESTADFINCYMYGNLELRNYIIRNSIIGFNQYSNGRIPSTVTLYNCIAGFTDTTPTELQNWFAESKGSGNTSLLNVKEIMTDDYKLTDEAAAQYLGTDGTQVGMYGGSSPFTAIPNYPRIKKLHVAQPQDGKIKVDIAVSSELAGE